MFMPVRADTLFSISFHCQEGAPALQYTKSMPINSKLTAFEKSVTLSVDPKAYGTVRWKLAESLWAVISSPVANGSGVIMRLRVFHFGVVRFNPKGSGTLRKRKTVSFFSYPFSLIVK
jgi:hypothetical protein